MIFGPGGPNTEGVQISRDSTCVYRASSSLVPRSSHVFQHTLKNMGRPGYEASWVDLHRATCIVVFKHGLCMATLFMCLQFSLSFVLILSLAFMLLEPLY